MNVTEAVAALDRMTAELATRRCLEPSWADHVRAGLEAQRRDPQLALLRRDQRAVIVAAITRVERVLDSATRDR